MGFLIIHSDHSPNPLHAALSEIVPDVVPSGSVSAPDNLAAPRDRDVRWVESTKAARNAYSAERGDVIVAAHPSEVPELLKSDPLLDVVLALPYPAEPDDVLEALRSGAVDVWTSRDLGEGQQPDPAGVLRQRLQKRRQAVRDRWLQYENQSRRDQRAGRNIQLGMLPPNPMMIGDYVLRHRVVPSEVLSGDFVDYFQLAQHFLVAYLADVSGHGASSAFVTVLLKNFSRRVRREYRVDMLQQPGLILAWLNRELLEQKIDKHVTMALLLIDLRTDTLLHVNAGHYPQVIHVRENGEARFVDAGGKPVGLFPEVAYTSATTTLAPGERLVVFSDGVLELLPEESLSAKEGRLLAAAAAGDRIEAVWTSLGFEQDGRRRDGPSADVHGPDDMSCLIVSREP